MPRLTSKAGCLTDGGHSPSRKHFARTFGNGPGAGFVVGEDDERVAEVGEDSELRFVSRFASAVADDPDAAAEFLLEAVAVPGRGKPWPRGCDLAGGHDRGHLRAEKLVLEQCLGEAEEVVEGRVGGG